MEEIKLGCYMFLGHDGSVTYYTAKELETNPMIGIPYPILTGTGWE